MNIPNVKSTKIIQNYPKLSTKPIKQNCKKRIAKVSGTQRTKIKQNMTKLCT